jgi:hypothetical protein
VFDLIAHDNRKCKNKQFSHLLAAPFYASAFAGLFFYVHCLPDFSVSLKAGKDRVFKRVVFTQEAPFIL